MARRKPLGRLGLLVLSWNILYENVEARETRLLPGFDDDNQRIFVPSHRTPALYTGDFGDCGGGGDDLFSITKFDAGLYRDNSTVLFHLHGSSTLVEENVMLHISVEAYGEQQFEMVFDPCLTQVYSMCPVDINMPLTAWALIPIPPSALDVIPSIAYQIPDFDGVARLQVFSNTTQTRVGCFQAALQNGQSLSHPIAIPIVLAFFTTLAILSSFALAVYGTAISQMRTHYAHAFSGLIIFETFHSIFLSGAVSLPWPSVLPAWRSNFAWASGLVYAEQIVDGVASFAGISGNASAANTVGSVVLDGGLPQRLYGRSAPAKRAAAAAVASSGKLANSLLKRQAPPFNASNPDDYTWAGGPARPGLPLPGSHGGFAGTLAVLKLPTSAAFLVALVWFFVLLALVAASIALLRWVLGLRWARARVDPDKVANFRAHLAGYIAVASLRTFFLGLTPLLTLALFQLASPAPAEVKAITGVMGFLVLLAVGSVVFYACFVRLRLGRYEVVRDRLRVEPSRVLKVIPAVTLVCHSSLPPEEEKARRPLATLPWLHVRYADDDPARVSVHEDDAYVKRFGWLTAHYRRTRWWFFAWWFGYQVVRAALLGAAVASPMAQVFGLLLIEVVAFIVTARLQPFEGSRNAAAAVWLLGISKVATAGLSIGFLPAFGLGGIPSTALAIIVVLIQLVLVAAVLVLIVLGVISSWMSLTRDRESFPASLASRRATFLAKVERRAADVPEPAKTASSEPEEEQKPIVPYFSVNSVRREPKIGETLGRLSDRYSMNNGSGVFLVAPGGLGSRPVSLTSRHSVSSLRRAALVHPGSRSAVDLALPPPEPPMRPAERPDSSRLRRQMSPPLEAPEDQGAALERVQARAADDKEVRRSVRWQ